MITETPLVIEPLTDINPTSQSQSWNKILAESVKDVEVLLSKLDIPITDLNRRQQASLDFPVLIPQPFIDKMNKGDANDPLLLQVLPQRFELDSEVGFIKDPLAEKHSNSQKGIIHKYYGRVLVLLSTGCAVNCRYCFRRHFPYEENRLGSKDWHDILSYIANDKSISELILSGGDPLMLNDQQLEKFIKQAEEIPHLERLRIHTRLPIVIPQRITNKLARILEDSHFQCVMVFHINHAQEINNELSLKLSELSKAGVTLLNQAVLLRHINDSIEQQVELSHSLFKSGVLPYYLHVLDKVAGAHHFDIGETEAQTLHQQLLLKLPGYLVPKLVRENAGAGSKTPL